MDSTNLNELLTNVGKAIKAAETGNDAYEYVIKIKKWLQDNAPEYLQ